MKRAAVEAILHGPSADALPSVRAAADAVGGFVVDGQWFGNLLLTAKVDMQVGDQDALVAALREQGLTLTSLSRVSGNLDGDLICAVAVRCVHDEGDVERDVPAVPG